MKIFPLGTSGFIPNATRETSSVLIKNDNSFFLFDAGTGIKRLAEKKIDSLISKADKMHLFFSHLHHDHTAGLTWLLRLFRGKLYIYVPEPPLVEFNGKEIIMSLTSPHMFGLPFMKWQNYGGLISYTEKKIDIDNTTIHILPQSHHGGSVGLRLGNFAYITDTEPSDEHLDFIQDCELVFIDTMHDRKDYEALNLNNNKRAEHGWSVGNGKIAMKSKIKQLGLIHIDPFYNSKRLKTLHKEAKQEFSNVIIPQEGESYSLK